MRMLVVVILLALAGCTSPTVGPSLPPPEPPWSDAPVHLPNLQNFVPDSYQGRFRYQGMVLQGPQGSPMFCLRYNNLGQVPNCLGLTVKGWSWEGLDQQSKLGTTWGFYEVIGHYDGESFTLTQPATRTGMPYVPGEIPRDPPPTPCPAPADGWPHNAPKSSQQDLNAAWEMARADPDLGRLWIHSGILNVQFTKDIEDQTARLRQVYGGPLCVRQTKYTLTYLNQLNGELWGPDVAYTHSDTMATGTLEYGLWRVSESRQQALDAQYGPGVVILNGVLRPMDPYK